jgi:hypothetical protein
VDWIHLAQEREVADFCEHSNESLGFMKGGKVLTS